MIIAVELAVQERGDYLKYHDILHDNMVNGSGLRVVLFVSGCNHYCKGCQNPVTWDANDGLEFDTDAMLEIYNQLSKDYISGLTCSGGDPLYPGNREEIYRLCQWTKKCFPDKTIWLYTGYLFEEVKDLPVMEYIDVLVDGPFIQELADVRYKWAGSTNQRIWRKVNGEWRVDENEYSELEERSAEKCGSCR